MLVAVQLLGEAVVPLKVIVLFPCVAPKFVPAMVTDVPTAAELGMIPVIAGGGVVTVNDTPLLAWPPTVTTTLPVEAPVGTEATMLDALQPVGVAAVPLNVTVLLPCVAPKFDPEIVIAVPTAPEVGITPVIDSETAIGVELLQAAIVIATAAASNKHIMLRSHLKFIRLVDSETGKRQ
jgi:hypothetical protein